MVNFIFSFTGSGVAFMVLVPLNFGRKGWIIGVLFFVKVKIHLFTYVTWVFYFRVLYQS